MCWTVRGSNPNGGKGLSLLQNILTSSGADLTLYSMDTRVSSWGVNQPRHESNHFPPPSTYVRNEWTYTSIPPHTFMAWKGKLFIFNIYY